MLKPITVKPGDKVRLADIPSRDDADGWDKEAAARRVEENTAVTRDLAYRLYAENRRSLLLVLQGMDTSGKDGAIRTVMTGINPQSCSVVSFKQPSAEELDHDFLWRIHKAVPRNGEIGVFNRSHYEDVLIVRVHGLVPEAVWRKRYDVINAFERLLVDAGTKVVKCFLHISKDEQRERLQARLDEPEKRWKFSLGDLAERKLWEDYQAAYEDALTRCNTEHAPWLIVPADRKWVRNLMISELLREALEAMDPRFPEPPPGLDGVVVE